MEARQRAVPLQGDLEVDRLAERRLRLTHFLVDREAADEPAEVGRLAFEREGSDVRFHRRRGERHPLHVAAETDPGSKASAVAPRVRRGAVPAGTRRDRVAALPDGHERHR
jgi:hypothetical protein